MSEISVIGGGRWGTFLAWYAAKYCKIEKVRIYSHPNSPEYKKMQATRKNAYLTLSDNMYLHEKISDILDNDFIIVSVGSQNLRELAKELNGYHISGKTFLLAMKGLEEPKATLLSTVMEEEIKQPIHIATLGGPGHVQDYVKGVPSCAVIDSNEEEVKDKAIKLLQSDLIRFYYGEDFIGNQIGAALKNVIGIAAGILDGLEWYGLKGALMARSPVEVGRFIKHYGGNPMTAYGLAHLGDYEATLFSKHSHNRTFGEKFVKGEEFGKLAEGYYTLKAVKTIADKENINMPICQALYRVIYENADIKQTIRTMFDRDLKHEFERF